MKICFATVESTNRATFEETLQEFYAETISTELVHVNSFKLDEDHIQWTAVVKYITDM